MGTILGPIPSTAFSDNIKGGRDLLPPCSLQWKTNALIRCSGLMGWRITTPLLLTTQNLIPDSGMWFDGVVFSDTISSWLVSRQF